MGSGDYQVILGLLYTTLLTFKGGARILTLWVLDFKRPGAYTPSYMRCHGTPLRRKFLQGMYKKNENIGDKYKNDIAYHYSATFISPFFKL